MYCYLNKTSYLLYLQLLLSSFSLENSSALNHSTEKHSKASVLFYVAQTESGELHSCAPPGHQDLQLWS